MKNIIKNNLGFSLIETIVSVAIFAVFMSVIFGTIFYTNKANDSIKISSDIQNDIRGVYDGLINGIKINAINYDYYQTNGNNYNIPLPSSSIYLNNNTIYRKTSNCYSTFSCIEASFNNGVTFQKITPSNVNVSRLDFYFLEPDNNTMPIVTIVLSGYIQNNRKQNYNFSYQNTVEIKTYIK